MKEKLIEMIKESGLSRISDKLIDMLLDSIRIRTKMTDEMSIETGKSKIGGHPDLPVEINWPTWNEIPLSFIAQINCGELESLDVSIDLPKTGMLYFFYESDQQTWGFDPADKGSWQVFYYNGGLEMLARRSFPDKLPESGAFLACAVQFENEISFPSWESIEIEKLRLDEDERNVYWNLSEQVSELLNTESQLVHKIGGYPDMIQGDMQLECQLASNGLYCGDSTGYSDPKRKELEVGATKWKLLLQIDSEEDIGMMWGDVGRLYFWINEEDLHKCKFDNVWFVLQCG